MDTEEKREIIMKHYTNPINRKRMEGYDVVNTRNESCVDNLDIYVKMKEDVIEDITFEGEACVMAISSTSIMIGNLLGKTRKEASDFILAFERMVETGEGNKELLKEAMVYQHIKDQGHRKTCVLLPYVGMKKMLEKKDL